MAGTIAKTDLEALSSARLEDARQLFQTGRFSAAYYLAGYAVELGIKASIAKLFQANAIPDKDLVNQTYSHKLDHLLGLAGLKRNLEEDGKNDPALMAAWGIASKWNETSRYEMRDKFAALNIINAIEHPQHGVLQWLKKHW